MALKKATGAIEKWYFDDEATPDPSRGKKRIVVCLASGASAVFEGSATSTVFCPHQWEQAWEMTLDQDASDENIVAALYDKTRGRLSDYRTTLWRLIRWGKSVERKNAWIRRNVDFVIVPHRCWGDEAHGQLRAGKLLHILIAFKGVANGPKRFRGVIYLEDPDPDPGYFYRSRIRSVVHSVDDIDFTPLLRPA